MKIKKIDRPFERLNSSRLLVALLLLAMFLIMLFCNIKTNLLADDFMYAFSFADGERIDSLGDIFPSMAAHRHSMNGRLFSHGLVQLFLMLPLGIFKVLNSLVLVAEVYLLYRIALGRREHNALLLSCIFAAIWAFTLNFGQVILWLDGSVNYLWSTFFALLFMKLYMDFFLYGKEPAHLWSKLLLLPAAFIVGAYSENCASTAIFGAVCFLLLGRFVKGQKPGWAMIAGVILAFCGFLFMMSAPAEISNKSSQLSFTDLFDNFIAALEMYRRIWIPLAVYIVLAAAAYSKGLDRDSQILAFMLALSSFAAVFVLTFASFFPERCAYIGLLLMIGADAVLFARMFSGDIRPALVSLGLICLLLGFYRGAVGVQDIIDTNYFLTENEKHILACKEEGIMDVEVYRVYPKTGYSPLEGLGYLNTEEADSWPNKYMAEYFGINSIIGG